jgi:hypothetical protein
MRADKEKVCRVVREKAEYVRRKVFALVFKETLKGMCAICTIALAEAFRIRGWRCRSFYGYFFPHGSTKGFKHCWLEDEHCIYDLTATQFGSEYPEVLIVPNDDPRYCNREMEVDLEGTYWKYAPEHERPTRELVAMIAPDKEKAHA